MNTMADSSFLITIADAIGIPLWLPSYKSPSRNNDAYHTKIAYHIRMFI